jgi:ketosteroid isomerase-like protein
MAREGNTRGRTPDEHLATWFPFAAHTVAGSVLRLPPNSRVRRAWLARVVRIGFEAWVRGDYEVLRAAADPEIEVHFEHDVTIGSTVPVGLNETYHGPDGYCESMAVWAEALKNFRADVDQVLDEASDQFLVIARHSGEGIASGMSVEVWGAIRYTVRRGKIVRADIYFGPDREGVRSAAGAATSAR